jgi:hypothetical protein
MTSSMKISVVLWFDMTKRSAPMSQQFNSEAPLNIVWNWIKQMEKDLGENVRKIEMFEVKK